MKRTRMGSGSKPLVVFGAVVALTCAAVLAGGDAFGAKIGFQGEDADLVDDPHAIGPRAKGFVVVVMSDFFTVSPNLLADLVIYGRLRVKKELRSFHAELGDVIVGDEFTGVDDLQIRERLMQNAFGNARRAGRIADAFFPGEGLVGTLRTIEEDIACGTGTIAGAFASCPEDASVPPNDDEVTKVMDVEIALDEPVTP